MNTPRTSSGDSRRSRAGLSTWVVLGAIAAAAALVALLGFHARPGSPAAKGIPPYVTGEVVEGPFVHEIWERGEIQSSSNVEIACQVKSVGGVSILEIVPEGKVVKAGDFLVRLDDSALQRELIQQEIACSNSESLAKDAEADLAAAKLELRAYEEGTYQQAEEQIESELFVAKENLRRAEEYLSYSRKMNQRGYVSDVQIEADEFSVEKARKELDVTNTKLRVLREFTRSKTVALLQAAVETAQGRLRSRSKAWELDRMRLDELKDQISKCTIVAPSPGQVVYANDPERRGAGGDLLVAQGRPVRERQIIIRLPDQNRMRVLAKVHESRIEHLQPGMEATVTLDAHPDVRLRGVVTSIGDYPLPTYSIYLSHIKEYEVVVEIETTLPNLRPGMSAQVTVVVRQIPSAVQVPINGVLERDKRYFCAVPLPQGGFETREIQVGPINETNAVVEAGLQAGEKVALTFPELETFLDLPESSQPADAAPEPSPDPLPDTGRVPIPGKGRAKVSAKAARRK